MKVSSYVQNLLNNIFHDDDLTDLDSDIDLVSEAGTKPEAQTLEENIEEHTEPSVVRSIEGLIEVPVSNISYDTMCLIVKWCKHYYAVNERKTALGSRDAVIDSNKTGCVSDSIDEMWTSIVNKKRDAGTEDGESNHESPVLDTWAREFLDVNPQTLTDIILAANFLDIEPLLQSTYQLLTEAFRGKSPREVITLFAHASDSENTVI